MTDTHIHSPDPHSSAIFNPNGHLSDEAFRMLFSESLDHMQSLEVSEHLSYCDECIAHYTDLICDDSLLEPLEPMAPIVLAQAKKSNRVLYLQKFFSVTVAASFALVFCIGNLFQPVGSLKTGRLAGAIQSSSQNVVEQSQKITSEIADSFNQFWNGIMRSQSDGFGNLKSIWE